MEGYEGKRFMAAHFAIENMIARYVVYIYTYMYRCEFIKDVRDKI